MDKLPCQLRKRDLVKSAAALKISLKPDSVDFMLSSCLHSGVLDYCDAVRSLI